MLSDERFEHRACDLSSALVSRLQECTDFVALATELLAMLPSSSTAAVIISSTPNGKPMAAISRGVEPAVVVWLMPTERHPRQTTFVAEGVPVATFDLLHEWAPVLGSGSIVDAN